MSYKDFGTEKPHNSQAFPLWVSDCDDILLPRIERSLLRYNRGITLRKTDNAVLRTGVICGLERIHALHENLPRGELLRALATHRLMKTAQAH